MKVTKIIQEDSFLKTDHFPNLEHPFDAIYGQIQARIPRTNNIDPINLNSSCKFKAYLLCLGNKQILRLAVLTYFNNVHTPKLDKLNKNRKLCSGLWILQKCKTNTNVFLPTTTIGQLRVTCLCA